MLQDALLLHRQNRIPEAISAYQRVLERWPATADAWFNLAVLQRQMRDLPAALASYQRALDAGVSEPEAVHLNRSVIYGDFLHDPAAAERELRLALARNPAYVPAWLNLGNLCEDLGRRDEAAAAYSRILALDGGCNEALARLANLQRADAVDPDLVPRLRRALAARDASPSERASLGFALGRLLDAQCEYAQAFSAYREANVASRASAGPAFQPYDRTRQSQLVQRLMAAGVEPRRTPAGKSSPPQPLFICGMFRSGSTLTEQMLANCAGVAGGGELDFLPRLVQRELAPFPDSLAGISEARWEEIAARYQAQLQQVAAQALHVIDKRPDNFLYIGVIKKLFPAAKIVHTTRDPLDNCLSVYFLHLDQQMSYALDLMDIGHYFGEYRRLMTYWKAVFGDDIIDFNYDELVRDPQAAMRRLCGLLGLDWPGAREPAAVGAAIKTASVWQVREPLYRSSSGRARHYSAELEPLRRYLAGLPTP